MNKSNKKGEVWAVSGSFHGDEAKGLSVTRLLKEVDICLKGTGGSNAGHVTHIGDKKYVTHLMPSGILEDGVMNVIGNGVVLNPVKLLEEINSFKEDGMNVSKDNLLISSAAHVTLSYHIFQDELEENEREEKDKIGSTLQGIAPTYTDKFARHGVRVEDLLDKNILRTKIQKSLDIRLQGNPAYSKFNVDELTEEYYGYGQTLKEHVTDTVHYLHEALDEGKIVLVEGSQGTLLDIDFGDYPFVTSSNSTTGGIFTGTGVGPSDLTRIISVVKAHSSKVAAGAYPTAFEVDTEEGAHIDELIFSRGGEAGSTTGRRRRLGFLDLVALKFSNRLNSTTELAVTKTDVLSDVPLRLCVAYEVTFLGDTETTVIDYYPMDSALLNTAKPVYKELPGFSADITKCRTWDDLPQELRDYVQFIEDFCDVPVTTVGVGPSVEQVIIKPTA